MLKQWTISWYETSRYNGNKVVRDGTYEVMAASEASAVERAYCESASGRADFHIADCMCIE